MLCALFQGKTISVKCKMINMTYDKRCIVMPDSDVEDVTVIDTLPWGYVVTNT